MARNHEKPTTGAAATLIRVGEYVDDHPTRGVDDYSLDELLELAEQLDDQPRVVADGGEPA